MSIASSLAAHGSSNFWVALSAGSTALLALITFFYMRSTGKMAKSAKATADDSKTAAIATQGIAEAMKTSVVAQAQLAKTQQETLELQMMRQTPEFMVTCHQYEGRGEGGESFWVAWAQLSVTGTAVSVRDVSLVELTTKTAEDPAPVTAQWEPGEQHILKGPPTPFIISPGAAILLDWVGPGVELDEGSAEGVAQISYILLSGGPIAAVRAQVVFVVAPHMKRGSTSA